MTVSGLVLPCPNPSPSRRPSPMHPRSDDSSFAIDTFPDAPPEGERWSSWDGATHGPKPRPDWSSPELGAVEQGPRVPPRPARRPTSTPSAAGCRMAPTPPARDCLMAAKRFRPAERRLFHRDAGYPRAGACAARVRCAPWPNAPSSVARSSPASWAYAEFEALIALTDLGLPVPYPVQHDGTEMLMEFIGTDGVAAPAFAAARVERAGLPGSLRVGPRHLVTLAGEAGRTATSRPTTSCSTTAGRVHRLAPDRRHHRQPPGFDFLRRDTHNLVSWFAGKGPTRDEEHLFGDLVAAATARW